MTRVLKPQSRRGACRGSYNIHLELTTDQGISIDPHSTTWICQHDTVNLCICRRHTAPYRSRSPRGLECVKGELDSADSWSRILPCMNRRNTCESLSECYRSSSDAVRAGVDCWTELSLAWTTG